MNSKRVKLLSLIFVVLTIVLTSCRTMENLPTGELVATYDSPDSDYTINIYLCDGGATTDFTIRGELVDNLNEEKKNIYWGYHEDEADVHWLDDETVVINGRTLHVLQDVYDFRNE